MVVSVDEAQMPQRAKTPTISVWRAGIGAQKAWARSSPSWPEKGTDARLNQTCVNTGAASLRPGEHLRLRRSRHAVLANGFKIVGIVHSVIIDSSLHR